MNTELVNRVFGCLFYDIVKLAKLAKPGIKVGDVNRRFKGEGSAKMRMAEWVVSECDADRLLSFIGEFEANASTYKATGKVTRKTPAETPEARSARIAREVRAEHGVPEPVAVQAQPVQAAPTSDEGAALADIIRRLAGNAVNADTVAAICAVEIAKALAAFKAPTHGLTVTVKSGDTEHTTDLPQQHRTFPRLLKRCALRDRKGNRLNIWIAGPAGSGKTTACENIASVLKLPFYTCGALDSDFRLVGYMDANGNYVKGVLYDAFKNGGAFLWDEIDGSHESALLSLNSALANGFMVFPNGELVTRHPDFVMLAAANTWGAGATFAYVGRIKQDAASLDRFIKIAWDYDQDLEIANSGNEAWARKVIRWRERCQNAQGIQHIISPRATYIGAVMLADGVPESEVIEELISAGLTPAQWQAIA